MIEIWKPVKEFEELYEVSNLGNIRKIGCKNQFGKYKLFKEIKPYKNEKGYLRVGLSKNNKRIIKKMHRLVAETFLVNPDNLPEVNHIDGNKQNNRVDNLEWCTHQQNVIHSWKNNLSKVKIGSENHASKKVKQYDKDGRLVKEWECMNDVQRELGINASHIGDVCRGRRKTAGGYKWDF